MVISPDAMAVMLDEGMTVKSLSDKLRVPIKDVLKKLLDRRMMATINTTLDVGTASMIAREFGVNVMTSGCSPATATGRVSAFGPDVINFVLRLCEAGMRVEVDPFTRRIRVEQAVARPAQVSPRPRPRTSRRPVMKLGCP